ncbi:MAG: glutaredoxin domain-containing protein [Vulcanimicrobiaceae bacterium]
MPLELYGTATCPYTKELRTELEWQCEAFVEYDVDADASARERLRRLVEAPCCVPVLVDGGRVVQIGWQGRTCYAGGP